MGKLSKLMRTGEVVFKTARAAIKRKASPPPREPLPVPEKRDYSASELADFDGQDTSKPTLLAISGTIYDVTPRRDFYGPGGPYEAFAGRECAVALAKMSFEESDLHADTSVLDGEEAEKLSDWIETFEGKYDVVGKVLPD